MFSKKLIGINIIMLYLYFGINYIKYGVLFSSPLIEFIVIYFVIAYVKKYLKIFRKNIKKNLLLLFFYFRNVFVNFFD